MDFPNALYHLKAGKKIRHEEFPPGMYVRMNDAGTSMLQGCPRADGEPGNVEITYRQDPTHAVSGEWEVIEEE